MENKYSKTKGLKSISFWGRVRKLLVEVTILLVKK